MTQYDFYRVAEIRYRVAKYRDQVALEAGVYMGYYLTWRKKWKRNKV